MFDYISSLCLAWGLNKLSLCILGLRAYYKYNVLFSVWQPDEKTDTTPMSVYLQLAPGEVSLAQWLETG